MRSTILAVASLLTLAACTNPPAAGGRDSAAAPAGASGAAGAATAGASANTSADSLAVIGVIERFRAALASGDSVAVMGLLTDDVMVLESGTLEDRAEYRSHHLQADIAFTRAVTAADTLVQLRLAGDAAWAVSTSRTTGSFEGRPVDSDGTELLVLRRSAGAWKIAAIHWSSRRHRA